MSGWKREDFYFVDPAELRSSPRGGWMRPLSAPTGGDVAVCPHCWGVNVGGERLCHRCGADMTLLLQESGGLRRTPAAQSPMPVRVSARLGPVMRAALLLVTALLAAAWLVAPLLGNSMGRWGDGAMGRTGRPQSSGEGHVRDVPGSVRKTRIAPSPIRPIAPSEGRRKNAVPVTASGRF